MSIKTLYSDYDCEIIHSLYVRKYLNLQGWCGTI